MILTRTQLAVAEEAGLRRLAKYMRMSRAFEAPRFEVEVFVWMTQQPQIGEMQ